MASQKFYTQKVSENKKFIPKLMQAAHRPKLVAYGDNTKRKET